MRAVRQNPTRSSWAALDRPTYVVDFRESAASSERWRLTDAVDVEDVLDWTRARQAGRPATVSLEVEDAFGLTVARVAELRPGATLYR